MRDIFINDYSHRRGIRIHALNYLSNLGLPCGKIYRNRKFINKNQWDTANIKFMKTKDETEQVKIFCAQIFNVPLKRLYKRQVKLKTGQILPIPNVIQELCESILENVETEGIFRQSGNRSKLLQIITEIDERGYLNGTSSISVIDLAALLRYFLRMLPEPLIPYAYHNLFLACCGLKKKKEVLLIATLLLPTDHLNLLTYLMQFFNEVTTYSRSNKMTSYKLAINIAGDIIPVYEFSHGIFDKTTEVTRLLIKGSYEIGIVTTTIQKKLDLEGRVGFNNTNLVMSLLNDFLKYFC